MVDGPEVLWLWNGELQAHVLDDQLSAIHRLGYGSIGIWPWSGLLIPYLSETYLERIAHVCATAARLGTHLWLADDVNWPSGLAGGHFLEAHPEHGQWALLCSTRWVGGTEPRTVAWRGEGEHLVAALALDNAGARYDLSGALEKSGHPIREHRIAQLDGYHIPWEATLWESEMRLPAGEWFVTIATLVRSRPLLPSATGTPSSPFTLGTIDAFRPEAVQAFASFALEPLARAAAPYLGTVVRGILTCPPPTLQPHPLSASEGWRLDVFPWAPDTPHLFGRRFGKPFHTHLPYLLAPLHEPAATASPLLQGLIEEVAGRYNEAYHQTLDRWCQSHGLRLLTTDPHRYHHVPYTVRGERKQALDPQRLIGIQIDAPRMAQAPHLSGSALVGGANATSKWTPVPGLGEVWEWEPASLNFLPLGAWADWRLSHDVATYEYHGTFVTEYVPPAVHLLFEEGVVRSLSINGTPMSLADARWPTSSEIECADVSYRLLDLDPALLHPSGANTVQATGLIPSRERILLNGQATLGPLALVGAFALRPLLAGTAPDLRVDTWGLVRPAGSLITGDWSRNGYPRFSGRATYRQSFLVPEAHTIVPARLVVDAFGGPAAVMLNEREIGRATETPHVFDLDGGLRRGLNRLEITCWTGLGPRLAGVSPAGLASVSLEALI
jgi:hypothetical protein